MHVRGGIRVSVLFATLLLITLPVDSWAQPAWANNSAFLGPITAEVKAHCRTILADGQSRGRVAGRMGQIGDSITVSSPFFRNAVVWGPQTNETGHDYGPIRSWLGSSWYESYGKGGGYGNDSGWRISWATDHGHPSQGVDFGNGTEPGNYSWALIMFGTNDIDNPGWTASGWIGSFRDFVQGYIDLGVIPVLSTIPPEAAHVGDGRVESANSAILALARSMKIPWIDYYALIRHHQPNSWNGTLISSDGTHPSYGGGGRDFSQDGLTTTDGYAARTKLTFDLAEKMKSIVFDNGPAEAPLATERPTMGSLKTRFRQD